VTSTLYRAVLPCVFFLVCLGLGYPTLNRYNIRTAMPDSADYARMVTSGAQAARPAYRARAAAAVVAIAPSAYHNQPEDAAAAARALFDIAGPMLSLSAALALAQPGWNLHGPRRPC